MGRRAWVAALVILVALLASFGAGWAWGGDAEAVSELERTVAAQARVSDSLEAIALDAQAWALENERERNTAIRELQLARAEVVQLRQRPAGVVDSLLLLVPDSIGLSVAVAEERGYWRDEVSGLEAIIEEKDEIIAGLRQSIEATNRAWLADRRRIDTLEELVAAKGRETRRWKIISFTIGALAASLAIFR